MLADFNLNRVMLLVTDVGDSFVLSILVVAAVAYLLICRSYREAAALGLSFLITSGIIGILKIAFISCGDGSFGLRSPSGHAALSIAVLGSLGFIGMQWLSGWRRYLPPILLCGLAVVIAVTRVPLRAHSVQEVLLGFFVGMTVMLAMWAILLRRRYSSQGKKATNLYMLFAVLIVLTSIAHGSRLPAEGVFNSLALKVRELAACK